MTQHNSRFSVITYFVYFAVSLTIITAYPRKTSQPCAKFFTKITNNSISTDHFEVLETAGTISNWPIVFNTNIYEHIVNITLLSSHGTIRLCYLDSLGSNSKCEIYNSDTIGRINALGYDVHRLFSVQCNNHKGLLCKESKFSPGHKDSTCETAIVPSGKCAVLYQDGDCNDCNFPSIELEANKPITVNFTVPSSFKIPEGYNVIAKYYNDHGNIEECFLSGSEDVATCDNPNLFRKDVTYNCKPALGN